MVLSPCRNQSGLPSSIEIDLQISGITRLFQQLSPNTLGLLHVIPFHFPSQKTRIKQTTSLEWWLKKSAIHETKLVFATFDHQPQLHGRPAWRFLKAKADSLIFLGLVKFQRVKPPSSSSDSDTLFLAGTLALQDCRSEASLFDLIQGNNWVHHD